MSDRSILAPAAIAEALQGGRRASDAGGASPSLPDDDALLAWLQSLPADHDADERLLEIVRSDRHFYVRQTAALSIRDPERLKPFAGDRHVGQILARRLSRAEDVAYLDALVQTSRHLEVRRAAKAQLITLRARLVRDNS